jgi:hypothetical protein
MQGEAGNWATATAPKFLDIFSASPQVITLAYETSGNMSVNDASIGAQVGNAVVNHNGSRANAEQLFPDGTVIHARVPGFWGQAVSVTVP